MPNNTLRSLKSVEGEKYVIKRIPTDNIINPRFLKIKIDHTTVLAT